MENKVDIEQTVNHWVIARHSGDSGDSMDLPVIELTANYIYDRAMLYFIWCEQHPIQRPEILKTNGQV